MLQTRGIYIEHNANGMPVFASKRVLGYEHSNPGLDEAIEDVKNNRVYKAENAKDLISQCLQ